MGDSGSQEGTWGRPWVTLGVPQVPLGDLGGLLGGPWVTLVVPCVTWGGP